MNEWIPLGIVGLVGRGQFNPNELYLRNHIVSYSGIGWLCLKPCKGITPCVGECWIPLGSYSEGGSLILDDEITESSTNAVSSMGIFKAIDGIRKLIPSKIATDTEDGLMSKEDKAKIDNFDTQLDKKAETFTYIDNVLTLLGKNGKVIKSVTIESKTNEPTQSIIVDSELSTTSKNPVENNVITKELAKKVSVIEGMGLSHNDFTDEYKSKIDAGISDIVSGNINIYADSSTGNDETGDGSSDNPYRTIEKAVSKIPKDLNGYQFVIRINGAFSNGIKINGNRNGSIYIIGDGTGTTVTGEVTITDMMNVHFRNINFNLSNMVCINVTNSLGIEFASCNMIGDGGYQSTSITSSMVFFSGCNVSNFYYGVRMSTGMVTYESGKITAGGTGIVVSRGMLTYNGVTITAPTQFFTGEGGRIYTGAQTSIGNY